MFKKSRKDTIVDQAQGLVRDLSDAVAPRLEQARDELAPRVSDARDTAAAKAAEARKQFDKQVAPQLDEARQKVASGARHKLEDARHSALVVAGEAERRGSLAKAALKGEDVKRKGSKRKKLLVVLGLAAIGAVVAKKLAGDQHADNWQSSYTPAPVPTPAPAAAPATGASPGETVADSAEEPHPVTTPDDPAEAVELKKDDQGS